jgi:hypothetical protein
VNHQAKAPSAGSTQATGSSRGLFRRAAAIRGTSSDSKGSGAPANCRLRTTLAVLALAIATFVATAAPALAAPSVTTPVVSDIAYTTANVTSEVDPQGGGFTSYAFQVSTNGTDWTDNAAGTFFQKETLHAGLTGLDDGTHYFVRLLAKKGFGGVTDPEATSPGPNPELTTLAADPPTIPSAVVATDIFSTSATGSAEVNRPAASDNVECQFEYISDAEFNANPPGEGFAGATVSQCVQNPIETEGNKNVTAPLGCTRPVTEPGSCLSPSTTYRLRVVAENAAGSVTKEASSTFTTAAKVAPPTVLATDSTATSYFTANVSGEVQRPVGADPALDTSCRFEYVTDEQFQIDGFASAGQTECVEAPSYAPLTGTDPTPVTAELTGLEDDTIYHLRLTAENGGGTDTEDAPATITTLTASDPILEVNQIPPGDIGYTRIHLTGFIDRGTPERNLESYIFELHTEPNPPELPGASCCSVNPGKTSEPTQDRTNLMPGTTYYARLVTFSGSDPETFRFSQAPLQSFTTKGTDAPPTATLDPVSDPGATIAHFSGTVDPNAPAETLNDEGKAVYKTKWHIECTPECKDVNGNEIGGTLEGDGGAQTVAGDAMRLEPLEHYEAKLIAENVVGTNESSQTFDTDEIPPTVKQTTGASDGEGGYTLQGVVNPNNQTITRCEFKWGPNTPNYAFSADCSPLPNPGAKSTTVEAHLTGLNPDVDYHALLVVTYGAGLKADSGEDQTFKATFDAREPCPENEDERIENNSLALPQCRAYEMVTPPGKEGWSANFETYDGGDRVLYVSGSPNIVKSGQNFGQVNFYIAERSESGWQTIPNLNGSSGSFYDAPSNVEAVAGAAAYSSDLRSSVWRLHRQGDPGTAKTPFAYLRRPDGTFALIGNANAGNGEFLNANVAMSADLSHLVTWASGGQPSKWGPGVYEFLGTGMDQPRRVDLDNSGTPVSSCIGRLPAPTNPPSSSNADALSVSHDGNTVLFLAYGALSAVSGTCQAGSPAVDELWARVNGTTSVDLSASHCDRVAPACNAPANPAFETATPDGSRVFFTTTQQLVDGDTDQTDDIYACDIPAGDPAPSAGKANPCAAFRQVSVGDSDGAVVESVDATSANGDTVLFTAKGVLADNEDALKEKAVAGDHNLYVWRINKSHPEGQTAFIGRLTTSDLRVAPSGGPQATPDGRYLVFTTVSQLLDTDTDSTRDVYRYDADTDALTRLSINVFGVAGNGEDFDALIPNEKEPSITGGPAKVAQPAISDDGTKVVFTTSQALSPDDGNAESDAYLWTPAGVSLITTGSVGSGVIGGNNGAPLVAIDASGDNIYFNTRGALTPADGDDLTDAYDARIGGGFSFAPKPICVEEGCQEDPSPQPGNRTFRSSEPGPPNPQPPKPCPRRKVRNKKGKCVRPHKKNSNKKHHGRKTSHKRGGGN